MSGSADAGALSTGYVAAYNPDGSAISSFNSGGGAGGVATLDYGSGQASGNAGIAIDGHRRMVVVGAANGKAGVGRLVDTRYAFDTTFGPTGQEPLACTNNVPGGADGVSVQPDSNIVVVGVCDHSVTLWRLGGGHEVDLPASPAAGGVTASQISANTGGRKKARAARLRAR